MMESTAFFNAKASSNSLSLFLDIDPKKDVIKDFFFEGPKASHYHSELEELKGLALGKSLQELHAIRRDQLKSETLLASGEKAIAPLGLWLLKKALANYEGEGQFFREQRDMVCLCFSITKSDIVKKVLANKDFELKTLINETMASSACGSCRHPILKIIVDTRASHGLIFGLDHSKSRLDKNGQWIKVAGLYPGPLLITLDELKKEWMKREGIEGQFVIDFTHIEGLHLTVSIDSGSDVVKAGLLSALTDFLKSRLGVLFFLKSGL